MKALLRITIIVCLVTVAFTTNAKVIYVDSSYTGGVKDGVSWSTPFTTLEEAITASASGDELWFAKGTYSPAYNQDSVTTIKLSHSLMFVGGFSGSESTILERDIDQNKTVFSSFYINASADTLRGALFEFEIQFEFIEYDGVTFSELAIISWIQFDVPPFLGNPYMKVSNCEFEGNTSLFQALDNCSVTLDNINFHDGKINAPIFSNTNNISSIRISNSSFSNDKGSNVALYSDELVIKNCDFFNMGSGGNFIYQNSITTTVENCTFSNNDRTIMVIDGDFSNPGTRCDLVDLEIKDCGEGPFNILSGKNTTSLTNVDMSNNAAAGNDLLEIGSGSFEIRNCTFENNILGNRYLVDGYSSSPGEKALRECVISGNSFNSSLFSLPSGGTTTLVLSDLEVSNNIGSTTSSTIFYVPSAGVYSVDNLVLDSNSTGGHLFYGPSGSTSYSFSDFSVSNHTFLSGSAFKINAANFVNLSVLNCSGTLNNFFEYVPGPISQNYMSECEFADNNIMLLGSFFRHYTSSTYSLSRWNISNNNFSFANNSIGLLEGYNFDVSNSVFADNLISGTNSFLMRSPYNITVKNSTFYSNSIGGERLFASSSPSTKYYLYNSIFWLNNYSDEISSGGEFNYCDVQGGYEGVGNLDLDPKFVDAQNNDLRLSCSSPLLNKGFNGYAPIENDINGVARIRGDTVDIGAFEFDGDPNISSSIPQVDFSFSNNSPCITEELSFLNNTPNSEYYKYSWNFGDESGSVIANSTKHTYDESGTFTVALTGTNTCGQSNSIQKDISVIDAFVPSILNKTTACPGDTFGFWTFANCSSMVWNVSGGTILSGQGTDSISIRFDTPVLENALISLSATDCGNGAVCELPVSLEIPVVQTEPVIIGEDSACISESQVYTLENRSLVPGAYYTWSITGGIITSGHQGYALDSVIVDWDENSGQGQLIVSITHELLTCAGVDTFSVNKSPRFSIVGDLEACGNSVSSYSTDFAGSFDWNLDQGAGSVDNNSAEVTWSNIPGLFYLGAVSTEQSAFCNLKDSILVQLFLTPDTIESIIGELKVDTTSIYTYTASHSNSDGLLIWSINGGRQIGGASSTISIIWDQGEPFSLMSAYVRDEGNCQSEFVSIEIEKDLFFGIDGEDLLCINTPTYYSTTMDTIPGLTYNWKLNGIVLGGTIDSIEVSFQNAGYNYLSYEVTYNGRSYSATKTVFVSALAAVLSIEGTEIISPSGGGTFVYEINNPGGLDLTYSVLGSASENLIDTSLTITWGTEGPFRIEVIGSKIGEECTTPIAFLDVQKADSLDGELAISGGSLCLNETTTVSFPGDQYVSNVQWSISGGGTFLSSDEDGATIEWASLPGTYEVTVNYNRFGAQSSSTQFVINPLPSPIINDGIICGEDDISISTTSSFQSYEWTLEPSPSVISSAASPIVNEAGFYKVKVQDGNGCFGASSNYIEYVPIPSAKIFTSTATSFCEEATTKTVTLNTFEGTNYSYQWIENNTPIIGANSPIYSYTQDISIPGSTSFTVRVTSAICEETSSAQTISIRTTAQCEGDTNNNNTCTENVSFSVSDCQPFSFTNTSAQISDFTWEFGDGKSSNDVTPTGKTYNELGNYTVTLKNGCARAYRSINVPVQALFTVPDVACKNSPVDFTDYSVNMVESNIDEWVWDFGDGTVEVYNSETLVSHTFATADTFQTSLTVRGLNTQGTLCSHTFELPLVVNDLPNVSFVITPPDCDDDLYVFTNTSNQSTPEASYTWDLAQGDVSTAEDPSKRFISFGTFSVSLAVTDYTTCINTDSQSLTVNAPVVAQKISPNNDLFICQGETIALNSPASESTYTWKKDGLVISENSAVLNASEPGKYTVTYVTSGCSLETENVTVSGFFPDYTLVQDNPACDGFDIVFDLENYNGWGQSISWYKNDTLIPNNRGELELQNLTNSNNGVYRAEVVQNSSGCLDISNSIDLEVNAIPFTPFISSNSNGACYGEDVLLYTFSQEHFQYTWLDGVAEVEVNNDSLLLSDLTFQKTIVLKKVNDSTECYSLSTPKVIDVEPQRNLQLFGENIACENSEYVLKSSFTEDFYDFDWYRNDTVLGVGANDLNINPLQVSDSGTYRLVATTNFGATVNGCVFSSDTFHLEVLKGPEAPIISGEDVFCEGANLELTTPETGDFEWSTSEITNSITIYQPGTYNLTVIDNATGCIARTSKEVELSPAPNFNFIGTGYYEWCGSEELTFLGLSSLPYYQWKLDGASYGSPNSELYPRATGSYTLFAETLDGCVGESDTLRITSLPCACEVVTTVDGFGIGSLRDAIYCANGKPGVDFIHFRIPGTGPFQLEVDSALPVIVEGVVLDGFSQTGIGIFDIEIIADEFTDQGLVFDFDVDQTEINGLIISGFENAVVFGSNSSNSIITNNQFSGNDISLTIGNGGDDNRIANNNFNADAEIAVLIQRSTGQQFEDNVIENGKVGINSIGTKTSNISGNEFKNLTGNGFYSLNTTSDNTFEDNYFSGLSENAIALNDASNSNVITGNHFGYEIDGAITANSKSAIRIKASNDNTIEGNYFVGHPQSAIYVTNSFNTNINANAIGYTKDSVVLGNLSHGIEIDSSFDISNNKIINADGYAVFANYSGTVEDNLLINNGLGGIRVVDDLVRLSQNSITNSDTTVKGIDLNGVGNQDKPYATILADSLGADKVKLSGVSDFVGDTIEIFYSDGSPQQALRYVGFGVTQADNTWEMYVPAGENYDVDKRNIYVNTASLNGRTSELSIPFTSGCYNCVCSVENYNDSGVGSLRSVIDSAHAGVCRIIEFNITPDTITLLTPIRDINVGIELNGPDPDDLIVIEGPGFGTLFNVNTNLSVFGQLGFTNWDVALEINGNGTTLDQLTITNVTTPISISGNENTITNTTINPDFTNDSTSVSANGIVVYGNNNVVGTIGNGNVILGTINSGVIIDGGLENSLLYNVLVSCESVGIIHVNGGNNDYSTPFNLASTYTTGPTISGEAQTGDLIQIFLTDISGIPVTEFVAEELIASTNWSVSLPASYDKPTENQFFIVTATDALGNTSELSGIIKLGNATQICEVFNTNNAGKGSLRAAITCVNQAGANGGGAEVIFSLPTGSNEIVLLDSGMTITNSYDVLIDPKLTDVTVSTNDALPYFLNWQVDSIEINNMTISGFQIALNASNANVITLASLNFEGNPIGLRIANSSNLVIDESTFRNATTGIELNMVDTALISNASFESSQVGIDLTIVNEIKVTDNRFTSLIGTDILTVGPSVSQEFTSNFFEGSTNAVVASGITELSVASNVFGRDESTTIQPLLGDAIQLDNGLNFQLANNNFFAIDGDAVTVSNSDSSVIELNMFGTTTETITGSAISIDESALVTGNTFAGILANAIEIGDNAIISANSISESGAGIVITGDDVKVSQTTFVTLGNKAIDLGLAGNSLKQPGLFESYNYSATELVLTGTSAFINDTIEIFHNTGADQEAIRYIGFAVTQSDLTWTLSIPAGVDYNADAINYYVNTATLNQETSELSAPYKVGCYSCVCLVTNYDDAGAGSLRAAVDSAHAGICRTVEFGVGAGEIALSTPIRDIEVEVIINGVQGIAVTGQGIGTLFNVNAENFEVNNLEFGDWDTSIALNANNALVTSVSVVSDVSIPFAISGNSNTVNNCVINEDGKLNPTITIGTAFAITGSNNVIGGNGLPNEIYGSINSPITIDGGIQNTVSYNVIEGNSSKGISHLNIGNNDYPSPLNLLGEYVADQPVISGVSSVGDLVQVFLSDFTGRPASEFVIEFTATTTAWSITLPAAYNDPSENQFFVLTSTDGAGNTSEFSEVVKLGDNTLFCIVTNTDDVGEGSLRDAVQCANVAGSGQGSAAAIVFDLPAGRNEIIVLNSGFTVTNSFGVTIDPENTEVAIIADAGVEQAFDWAVNGLTIENLEFIGFSKAALSTIGASGFRISNNEFSANNVALDIINTGNGTISLNTILSGDTGLVAYDANIVIDNNDFGDEAKLLTVGMVVDTSIGTSISNNDFFGSLNGINLDVDRSKDLIIAGNDFFNDTLMPVGLMIANSTEISFSSNNNKGAVIGMKLIDSEHCSISQNNFDSVTVAGIELEGSEFINLTRNLAKGVDTTSKVIDLNYGGSDVSNLAVAIPVFDYATYKNGNLILRGTSIPEGTIELFTTDTTTQSELTSYLKTATADQFGRFEFKLVTAPVDINKRTFKATATYPSIYLGGKDALYPYTSEVSAAFNPNLKICFVVSESDDDVEGTLRYNIGLANQDKCNLMLFAVPNVLDVNITPLTDLPIVTARELTIDATSQEDYAGIPIVRLNETVNITNAFEINNPTGKFALHGMEINGFEYPIQINQTDFFENSISVFNDFETHAIGFGNPEASSILLDSSTYQSDSVIQVLDVSVANVTAKSNKFIGAKEEVVLFRGDSTLFYENEISSNELKDGFGLIARNSTNSYLSGNTIENHRKGILSELDSGLFVISNEIFLELNDSEMDTLSVGVKVLNTKRSSFLSNRIAKSDTAIHIMTSEYVYGSGNRIDSAISIGMLVEASDSIQAESNRINGLSLGIQLDSCTRIALFGNTVYGHDSVGIYIDSLSGGNLLGNNKVGAQSASSVLESSKGVGIEIHSSDNKIGGVDTLGNQVYRNLSGGIHVIKGLRNEITYNEIFDNDTIDTRPSHFAILHIDSGNVEKLKPTIISYEELTANSRYRIFGTSEPGDSIHLYRSEGYYQNARYFIGETITDGSGDWSIIVDTASFEKKLYNNTLTVVATATDADYNTSELSDMAYVGTCFVTNNFDNTDNEYPTPNSFRQAVTCANRLPVKDSLLFSIDGGTGFDIPIAQEMITLTNVNGLVFDAYNLIGNELPIKVFAGYDPDATDTTLFWEIADSVGPSSFANMKVQNFDTSFFFRATSPVSIDSIAFSGVTAYAITLEKGVSNYTMNKLELENSVGGSLLHLPDSNVSITLSGAKVKSSTSAVMATNSIDLTIEKGEYDYLPIAVNASNIKNIHLNENIIKQGSGYRSIELTNVSGEVTLNEFKELSVGTPLIIKNSDSLIIGENVFADVIDTAISVTNSIHMTLSGNTIEEVAAHAIFISNSDSIYVFANEVSKADSGTVIELVNSNAVKVSQNLILEIDTSDNKVTGLININKGVAGVLSNDSKQEPIIEGYLTKLEEECDEDDHISIFLYGQAQPLDSIEVFISDTITTTFEIYLSTVQADDGGFWEAKIDKKYYERELDHIYSFVAVAHDSLLNASQESIVYRFDSVSNPVVIKTVADTGVGTLRAAVDLINCSDIHSFVYFEIDDPAPYEIVLTDSLPAIEPWAGFTMDASGTQGAYLREEGQTAFDSTIVVEASDFEEHTLFTLKGTNDISWAEIFNIEFKNTSKVLQLESSMNQIYNVKINNNEIIEFADTAIHITGSSSAELHDLEISGYSKAILLDEEASGNTISENVFRNVNVAVALDGASGMNTISNNAFTYDSLAITIQKVSSANTITNNVFGGQESPISTTGIYLRAASNQVIAGNHMPSGTGSTTDSLIAFIYISDSSDNNQLLSNRIGIDSSGLVGIASNMVGIWMEASDKDGGLLNNVITANEIAGTSAPAVYMKRVEGGAVTGNYLGVDTAFIQRGTDQESFNSVSGIDTTAIVGDSISFVEISGNTIINFGEFGYGIDLRYSEGVGINKNQILSEFSKLKGIQLNLGTAEESNDGIVAPIIDSNTVISSTRIMLIGSTLYPDAEIQIFEGYTTVDDENDHSLRYITSVYANDTGGFEVELPSDNFGFSKYNRYIAQVNEGGNSSEFSSLYTLESLLCLLTDNGLDLLSDTGYAPCPLSNFEVDAQLAGLTYKWYPEALQFDTIRTQVAQIDSTSQMTLEIADNFGCVHVETFEVDYKPTPQTPEFLVSSNTFVSDTILIIDISEVQPTEYHWNSTDGLFIIEDTTEEAIVGPDGNEYPPGRFVQVILPDSGQFEITQTSLREGCFVSITKTLDVTFKDPDAEDPYELAVGVNSLSVYPNPAVQGELFTAFIETTNDELVEVFVYDTQGREMFYEVLAGKTDYRVEFETTGLPPDVYIFKLQTVSTVLNYKVTIQ